MASFLPPDPTLERRIREVGASLFVRMNATTSPGIFSRQGAYTRLMEWSLRDPAFKTQLFRFVDVLPALRTHAEIVRHLQEYLGDRAVELNPAMKAGLAAALMEIFLEAGVPPGVINLLTGHGGDVGAHLVAHPEIDFVAFTGSRSVGLKIWETAGRTGAGQRNLKKVVCEMGGKNALIIDTDADFDEAIPAALYSAFGFSGQKCSALSRLIVLNDIYNDFVKRLVAAAAALPFGDPQLPGTVIGPVIDADAQIKILATIKQGKCEAVLAWQGTVSSELNASGGFYVPPTIFTDVPPEAVLAREEIFGPVLAVMRAPGLDAAFALANATDYALTAGLFSRSPSAASRRTRIAGGEPLSQSRPHRRHRRTASIRQVQDERQRDQSRRARLSGEFSFSPRHRGERAPPRIHSG